MRLACWSGAKRTFWGGSTALYTLRLKVISAYDLAKEFHETYEQLAPQYGYKTRAESAVPWEDVPENNRRLMAAVMQHVMLPKLARRHRTDGLSREVREWLHGKPKQRATLSKEMLEHLHEVGRQEAQRQAAESKHAEAGEAGVAGS